MRLSGTSGFGVASYPLRAADCVRMERKNICDTNLQAKSEEDRLHHLQPQLL
jgi:hypothetical protein